MTHLIDTCGWIEWLTEGIVVEKYEVYLNDLETVYVPTSVQLELYKWVKREFDETKALEVIAVTEQANIIPLDTAIALLAADLSLEHGLTFADSIIYASAQRNHIDLITSDKHFKKLKDVVFINKSIH